MSPFGLLHNKTYTPQQHHRHEVWLRFKVGSSYDQVHSQENLAILKTFTTLGTEHHSFVIQHYIKNTHGSMSPGNCVIHIFLPCSRMALLAQTRALFWTFLLLHLDIIHIHVNTQPQGLPSNNDEVEHINLERMVLPGDREDMQHMLSNTLHKQDNTTSTIFFECKKSICLSLSSY